MHTKFKRRHKIFMRSSSFFIQDLRFTPIANLNKTHKKISFLRQTKKLNHRTNSPHLHQKQQQQLQQLPSAVAVDFSKTPHQQQHHHLSKEATQGYPHHRTQERHNRFNITLARGYFAKATRHHHHHHHHQLL